MDSGRRISYVCRRWRVTGTPVGDGRALREAWGNRLVSSMVDVRARGRVLQIRHASRPRPACAFSRWRPGMSGSPFADPRRGTVRTRTSTI